MEDTNNTNQAIDINELIFWHGELSIENKLIKNRLSRALEENAALLNEFRKVTAELESVKMSYHSIEKEIEPLRRNNHDNATQLTQANKTIFDIQARLKAKALENEKLIADNRQLVNCKQVLENEKEELLKKLSRKKK